MTSLRLAPVFRILHWSVALVVVLNSFVLEEGDPPHRYLGYACFSFVVIRLFLFKKRTVPHYNPKAKYLYWAIWLCIGALASTGFMMGLDQFWGNETLENIHELISNILLGFVFIHLSGVFFDAFQNKRRTWMVMITGNKE